MSFIKRYKGNKISLHIHHSINILHFLTFQKFKNNSSLYFFIHQHRLQFSSPASYQIKLLRTTTTNTKKKRKNASNLSINSSFFLRRTPIPRINVKIPFPTFIDFYSLSFFPVTRAWTLKLPKRSYISHPHPWPIYPISAA